MGKKLKSEEHAFFIDIRFLASKFFLASAYMPGKWLVRWYIYILRRKVGLTGPSIQ